MEPDINGKTENCVNGSVDNKDVPYGFGETWPGKSKHPSATVLS